MSGGKAKAQLRQWSLLGTLLRRLPLIDALDFMDRAWGDRQVRWLVLRDACALGASLSSCLAGMPSRVVRAVREGEASHDLPERLEDLDAGEREGGGAGPVSVDPLAELLRSARKDQIRRILLPPPGGDDLQIRLQKGGRWKDGMRFPAYYAAVFVRRICVMAARPYWAAGPIDGTFTLAGVGGRVQVRATSHPGGGVLLDLKCR